VKSADGYMASGFLGMLIPRGNKTKQSEAEIIFNETTGQNARVVFNTSDFIAAFTYNSSVNFIADKHAKTCLLLHGEVISTQVDQHRAAGELLGIYNKSGLSGLSANLHGSCAVVIVDEKADVIACITDRINSRKVFFSRVNHISWLSTSLRLHPTDKVDPSGVASYLINRFIYADRTVFSGVSTLERSSVHTFHPTNISSAAYWSYDFEASYSRETVNEGEMISQLGDLLHQSIERRLPRVNGNSLCSLSGGLDSRMVLGLLLGHLPDRTRLLTLSYGSETDSDVEVAQQITRELGIRHKLSSFSGSLPETIRLNGELCEGLVFFYTQGLSGTQQLSEGHGSDDVLFLGDECFGWGNMPLSSFEDVLQKGIGIRAPASVPNYYSYGNYRHETVAAELRDDNEKLWKRCPPCANWHDYKDFLYLDQRLANMIMTWREFHAARFIKVSNPLLDYDILDFMKTVPTTCRLDKSLFRKAMKTMNPELSRFPYAKAGGIENRKIQLLLDTQHIAIMELISDYESRLDDVIPPDLIKICLLDLVQRQKLDGLLIPSFLTTALDKIRRKYLAMKWYRSSGFSKTESIDRYGILALAPIQLEALIALRYFLKI